MIGNQSLILPQALNAVLPVEAVDFPVGQLEQTISLTTSLYSPAAHWLHEEPSKP